MAVINDGGGGWWSFYSKHRFGLQAEPGQANMFEMANRFSLWN
tara:strand:- start:2203 stop:2331 length:129 start_codon:yes stop_codon:yes gene_type:complete